MFSEPDAELTRAGQVLRVNGVRLMVLAGAPTVGLWSDLDGPHIRAALARLGSGSLPVRYLDGPGIPMRFKARVPKGQPVPLDIVKAMQEADGEHPWVIRDRMLRAIDWHYKLHIFV